MFIFKSRFGECVHELPLLEEVSSFSFSFHFCVCVCFVCFPFLFLVFLEEG